MRARDVKGKTVERIVQQRFWNAQVGQFSYDLQVIYFTDGSRLQLHASETEMEPYVTGINRPARSSE